MKILFDHQTFEIQTHGGVSRCFWELYKHLPKDTKAEISIKESNNAYLQLPGIKPLGFEYENFIFNHYWVGKRTMFNWFNKLRGYDYWNLNKNYSIEKLRKGDFDVFHPTYFDDYFLEHLGNKPFVLTIHDMIPEKFPQYFARGDFQILMKRKLAPLASAIVAVSENTKQDILEILKVPEEKIHVIYHGSNNTCPPDNCSKTAFPYILYVGGRSDYKQFKEWLPHLNVFLLQHSEIQVVCTGKPFQNDEIEYMQQLGIQDRFKHIFVKNDQELYSLYHNATAFVYTSAYEGFGIPIIEAYQAGCPVMLNRASCFPEIAGDAATYFELTNEGSDFAMQMEYLYNLSIVQKNELVKKQNERLAHYSWAKASQQLSDLYQSVI